MTEWRYKRPPPLGSVWAAGTLLLVDDDHGMSGVRRLSKPAASGSAASSEALPCRFSQDLSG